MNAMNAHEAYAKATEAQEAKRDKDAEQMAKATLAELHELIAAKCSQGYFVASKRLPIDIGRTASAMVQASLEMDGYDVAYQGREILIRWTDPE